MAGVAAATTGVAATEGVFRFESCVQTNDRGGSPRLSREARRLSCGHVDGVEAVPAS